MANSRFKTKPMAHQLQNYKRAWDKPVFAHLDEQGTGKTKVLIDSAASLYGSEKIDLLLVVAPKGVDLVWRDEQLPEHMPDWTNYVAAVWRPHFTRTLRQQWERMEFAKSRPLRVALFTYEGIVSKEGMAVARSLMQRFRTLMALDESHYIASMESTRTKNILKLKRYARYRRIASGTPYTTAPFSLFPQFSFLDEDILETSSFYAFKAEYSEILEPESNHHVLRHIRARLKAAHPTWSETAINKRLPQIVARDNSGQPKYRNIERLNKLIAPHSTRSLKKDCVDLPLKVYVKVMYEMTPAQAEAYESMREELRAEWAGLMTVASKLTAMGRLQQIACGYLVDNGVWHSMFKNPLDNPRIAATLDWVDSQTGPVILWSRYVEDTRTFLRHYGKKAVGYYGETSDTKRKESLARFKGGDARVFVGNVQSGGTGLTLNIASAMIYHANEFKLVPRLQSEDRFHRIGQNADQCLIADVEGVGVTVDPYTISNLRSKKDIADLVLGDEGGSWI